MKEKKDAEDASKESRYFSTIRSSSFVVTPGTTWSFRNWKVFSTTRQLLLIRATSMEVFRGISRSIRFETRRRRISESRGAQNYRKTARREGKTSMLWTACVQNLKKHSAAANRLRELHRRVRLEWEFEGVNPETCRETPGNYPKRKEREWSGRIERGRQASSRKKQ